VHPCSDPRPSLDCCWMQVYRHGRWSKLPGEALAPGDVISIGRPTGAQPLFSWHSRCQHVLHPSRGCPMPASCWIATKMLGTVCNV